MVENEEGKLKLRNRGNDRGFQTNGDPHILEPINEGDPETKVRVYSFDEEDVDEIVSILDQFVITSGRKWGGTSYVSAYRRKTDDLEKQLKTLEEELNDANNEFLKDIDTGEFDQFVYDITLSDGTVIPGISEDALDYYKDKFDLIFSENISLTDN